MLRLYTFSMSHFSEKIRWALDYAGLAYQEVRWTPTLHLVPALLKGRKGTTVPILQTPQGYVQDSTAILLWLERNCAPFPLIPADGVLRKRALHWESHMDRLGVHVVRLAYAHAFGHPDYVRRLWTLDASPAQKLLVRGSYPLSRRAFARHLNLSDAAVQASTRKISQGLAALQTQLQRGGPYLFGPQFGVAELSTAALLAPLACPPEHPVYGRAEHRQVLAPLLDRWDQHPGMHWVRRMYREHRRARA
ncbi:MAG: glutathione S-transferase family protein [Gammaproteobacteria bacterium]